MDLSGSKIIQIHGLVADDGALGRGRDGRLDEMVDRVPEEDGQIDPLPQQDHDRETHQHPIAEGHFSVLREYQTHRDRFA